jgi:uncharacterized OB-fold protein
MTDLVGKNLPHPNPETAPYWEGCREQKLLIQRCSSCGHHQFYPRILCTECTSQQVEWVSACGRGKVVSFTIVRQAISEAYAADVPYVIALIQLDEGPTMMSNVIQSDPESVMVGMPVEVIFEAWSEEITVPKFCPLV